MTNTVQHVGLIPDGGRRWAIEHDLPLVESYKISMGKLEECLDAFYANGVNSVCIYMLSKWNLARSASDLEAVGIAESLFVETVVPAIRERWSVKVQVAGNLEPVPQRLRESAVKVHSQSKHSGRNLWLCIGYDPFDELLQACTGSWNSQDELLKALWVQQRLDLVIRTGGARTLSDFLPLQAGYAQLVFLDKLFNDTTASEFLAIIKTQEINKSRFGK